MPICTSKIRYAIKDWKRCERSFHCSTVKHHTRLKRNQVKG